MAATADDGDGGAGRFGEIRRAAWKWAYDTKSTIVGFPTRRRRSWSQRGTRNELNEVLWQEVQGEYVPDAENRKQKLLQDWLDDQEAKVKTYNGDHPSRATPPQQGHITELLEQRQEGFAAAAQRTVSRYVNGRGEFANSRTQMLQDLDSLDADTYDDRQQVAYRTDEQVRQDLFTASLNAYNADMSEEEVDELQEYADELREAETDGLQKSEDIVEYDRDRIADILSGASGINQEILEDWIVPTYINETGDFDADRETLVHQLVHAYDTHDYEDLVPLSDGAVRKQLLKTRIQEDHDPHLTDDELDELAVYAENLRAHTDIELDAEQPDAYAEARSDGGSSATPDPYQPSTIEEPVDTPTPVQDTELPEAYTADGYEIKNEFTTTAYNTYQKIDTDAGFEYRKNGVPTSPQAYAGASAHKLPGSDHHV